MSNCNIRNAKEEWFPKHSNENPFTIDCKKRKHFVGARCSLEGIKCYADGF